MRKIRKSTSFLDASGWCPTSRWRLVFDLETEWSLRLSLPTHSRRILRLKVFLEKAYA